MQVPEPTKINTTQWPDIHVLNVFQHKFVQVAESFLAAYPDLGWGVLQNNVSF